MRNHLSSPSKVTIRQPSPLPHRPIPSPYLPQITLHPSSRPPRYLRSECSPKRYHNRHRIQRPDSVHPASMLSQRNINWRTIISNWRRIHEKLRTHGHLISYSYNYSILRLEMFFRIHPYYLNKLR